MNIQKIKFTVMLPAGGMDGDRCDRVDEPGESPERVDSQFTHRSHASAGPGTVGTVQSWYQSSPLTALMMRVIMPIIPKHISSASPVGSVMTLR